MPNILLLADETHGARLKSDLEYIGYNIQHLVFGVSSDFAAESGGKISAPVDLILLDLEAAPNRLTEIVQELAKNRRTQNKPLLVVAGEIAALRLDFSLGISDFVVKPYSLREMEARLRLVLWNQDRPDDEHTLKISDLVINLTRYEVRVRGVLIQLTLKEYELLKHLVTHRGRVFTRSDLLDSIWGYDYYGGMRTVDVHVRRLRSKLGDMEDAIATVRGVGYRFNPP